MSGKAGGYYGCLGAAKGACDGRMLVERKLAEEVILEAVCEQLERAEHIRHLREGVEAEVAKLYAHATSEPDHGNAVFVQNRDHANLFNCDGRARG